jgi:transposase
LDLGTVRAYLVADTHRIDCAEHGSVIAAVPWARPGGRHSYAFEDTCAWLAAHAPGSVVSQMLRVSWRTVNGIVTRVVADLAGKTDQLDGLRRIGIDEIAHRKGHRYLTVVVDHDTGRLVWAAPGRDRATLRSFFDQLGPDRSAAITHVSADQADWITEVVAERCPHAVECADPFHIVKWATDALDEVRPQAWNDARRAGQTKGKGYRNRVATGDARRFKYARYALWKNPENLTDRQREKLAWIAKTDPRLHRAYLLKEGLRYVFAVKSEAGKQALDRWLSWARRCRIPAFVHLAKRISAVRPHIDAALEHGLSNALIESVNTKIRLITRVAFGFRSATALIALVMLSLGGHRPALPGRIDPRIGQ